MVSYTTQEAMESYNSAPQSFEPGTYPCEVKDVTLKTTRGGDEMYSIKYKHAKTGESIGYDNLVFSKKGLGIATKKVSILGIKPVDGVYEYGPEDLIGLRAMITWRLETGQRSSGRKFLEPDFNADDFGYAICKDEDDDIPF